MTTWFISRHPGAVEWAQRQGLHVDRFVAHLDPSTVQRGDMVIGSLPVNLAAQVCAAGASYGHLSLELPANLRGVELGANAMQHLQAKIELFDIKHKATNIDIAL